MSKVVREDVVSWVLHSIKSTLGYEDVRRTVLTHLYPDVQHPTHIKTFDAHIAYTTKASYDKNYQKKVDQILHYCESATHLAEYVIFTATNLEEYRTKAQGRDTETHYQMFIIDTTHKTLFVIDPALKPNKRPGIYTPQVALDIVMPWFKDYGYKTTFVPLSNPAQTDSSEDNADVFCQSWSLYILWQVLVQGGGDGSGGKGHKFSGITVKIPKGQTKRYEILLEFYKRILTEIPSIGVDLNREFVSELTSYKPDGYKNMLKVKALGVALTITPNEMYSTIDDADAEA